MKINIQKPKFIASSPITSWQIGGEKLEAVTYFIFLGSKITVDGDYSHEIKKCFLIGRKAMTNLDSVLKSRDITLLKKVCILKAMLFFFFFSPEVMYECESWPIKKAGRRRIDAFKLWWWRRLFTVPSTATSNWSTLKESTLNILWKA